MKLWKKTVILMLATLFISLAAVGGLTLFITGRHRLENAAQTYGRQMQAAARMMSQFWDNGKYGRMTETGKNSYRNFQFRQCCGEGFALLEDSSAVENLTGYDIVDAKAMKTEKISGIESAGNALSENYDYRIQKLSGKYLMLQKMTLERPEGFELLSVRDITADVRDICRLALWFLGVYAVIFLLAGAFIYHMMRKTVLAMEQLQEVAEKQELLLGSLAHEMKTPLTSIIGYSDSLLHVKLEETMKERALLHINQEGRRLEALSGKMLQMMGLYQNEAICVREHFVGELVRRVEEMETESAFQKGILFRTECEDFSMCMDLELMESLLLNLVDNAIHASKEGDVILLRTFVQDGDKIFQVTDQGRGIPQEEIQKVTEAFYMVNKSRSRREGGAGLGLALCTQIAALHQGKLEIQSKEGKGTTVTVRFP